MTDISKIDMDRINGLIEKLESMKYVVETGQSEDGSQWYRVWSDGWIEQGGFRTDADVASSIVFIKPFSNATYTLVSQMIKNDTTNETGSDVTPRLFNQTNLSFGYKLMIVSGGTDQGDRNWSWYACGY